MKKSMKKSIKKALALMLVVCMLPFTDYATAFAVSNRQMDNIQTDSMETGAGDATVNVEVDTVSENQVQGEGAGNKETAETVNTEAETLETAETVDTEAETPDSLNLNENMVLNEDMVVYDLSVSEGTGSNGYPIDTTLDLNGHTLTVLNNATFESGSILSFNGGSLCVSRNVELQERCNFAMEDEEDYLFVGGNLDWKIRCGYDNSDEYDYDAVNLSKGTIELQGDFTADKYDTFTASDEFHVIFSGEEKQTIKLYEGMSALGNVEFLNTSEEGIYTEKPFACINLMQNESKFTVGADEVASGYVLNEDVVMEGDFCLGSGTLDLAGHTLTIQGSFIQTGGTVFVNGGALIVENDYRIQSRTYLQNDETLEEYQYGYSDGLLNMTGEEDKVLVKGSFYTNSRIDHQGFLTAGILEVKGDFYQYADGSLCNFIATANHKVLLSGDKKQTVDFGTNKAPASHFANLELQNTSEEGVEFVNRPYVAGEISENDTKIEGVISVGSKTVYTGQTYGGDIYTITNISFKEDITFGGDVTVASYVNIYGNVTVEGNVTVQKNYITFMGGKLVVGENFSTDSEASGYGIKMTNDADYLLVYGDFYYNAKSSISKTTGSIEVKGNVEIVSGFSAEEAHVFLLSGDRQQEITVGEENKFYELRIENYSEEGVHILTNISFEVLTDNDCNVIYYSEVLAKNTTVNGDYEISADNYNVNGKTLTIKGNYIQNQGIVKLNKGNIVIEGDLLLTDGTINLQGGSVTVKGSLIQAGGTIQVENGTLTVLGDYRLQKRIEADGSYLYTTSNGILQMTKEGGKVVVEGDFYTASLESHANCLTNGTMELKGNFTQETEANEYSFACSKNHLLLLSGTKKQEITFKPVDYVADNLQEKSTIANLEITNTSKAGVVFVNQPAVHGTINDHQNNVSGTVTVIKGDETVFEDGHFGGSVVFYGNVLQMKEVLLIQGDLEIHGNFSLDNDLEVEGSCWVKEGTISPDGHTMKIRGNLTVEETSKYGLNFEDNGHIIVQGNLTYTPETCKEEHLSKGILEIKGDATFGGAFKASGSQKVIFSGSATQNVSAVYAKFAVIELQNQSKKGVVATTLLDYNSLITNGYRLSYGVENDNQAAVTGFTLQKDYTVSGDLYLMDGKMDLNGYTLTVEGDLIQASGDMVINGGILFVKGDYRMQYRTGFSDNYTYEQGKARLNMTNAEDNVLVVGDFYCSTKKSLEGLLTDGTLEVRGDFIQSGSSNFIATNNHTVILGRKVDEEGNAYKQTVSFEMNPGITRFHTVVLTKLEDKGYTFKNELSSVSDEIVYDYYDETAPTAVTCISAKCVESGAITIQYDGASDNEKIIGYEIYRNGTKVGETSEKTFRDTGLKADTLYTYTVYAFDDYRNVAKTSPECSEKTLVDTEAPKTVTGLEVTQVTGSSITIGWKKAADNVDTTDYKVYRDGKEIGSSGGELWFKDSGLKEDEEHTYYVVAYDESGNESEKSEEVNAFTEIPEFTHIFPKNGIKVGGDSIGLSVSYKSEYPTNGCKIDIEYYDSESDNWIAIAENLQDDETHSDNSYSVFYRWDIRELTQSQNLKIRFSLEDLDGHSNAIEHTYSLDKTAPKAPKGLKTKSKDGVVTLSWNPSTDEDCAYFIVFKKDTETGLCEKLKKVEEIDNTTLEDKDVVIGKKYEYYIQAVDYFEQGSSLSTSVYVTVDEDTVAPVVQYISVNKRIRSKASVWIKAEDNRKVESVSLYCKSTTESKYQLIEKKQCTSEQITFHWDTTVIADGTYILKAVAVDDSGNCSSVTSIKTTQCKVDNTGVSQVKIIDSTVTSTEVQLKWEDLPEDDRSYFVVEKIEDGKREIVNWSHSLGANIYNLTPDTKYTFVVTGYDDLGNAGIESEPYEVTTNSDNVSPVLNRVYLDYGIDKGICFKTYVSDNAGVDKVVFSYSKDKINYSEIGTVSCNGVRTKSFDFGWITSDLEEGDAYIKIDIYDVYGNKNQFTEEDIISCIIDRTAPNPVENVKISGTEGCISLEWEKSPEEDVEKYRIYRAKASVGIYRLLDETTLNVYKDRNVVADGIYSYKVVAVDKTENESEKSKNAVTAMAGTDREAPSVEGFSIKDGDIVGGNTEISVIACDNVALQSITLEFRKAGNVYWKKIGEYAVSSEVEKLEEIWDTTGLVSGDYEVRIVAVDQNNNSSSYFKVNCTLDTEAPTVSEFMIEEVEGKLQISCAKNAEKDFCEYKLYKKSADSLEYDCIYQGDNNSYTDKKVTISTKYFYYIEAYDAVGNCSKSEELSITTDSVDRQAPEVIIPKQTGISGKSMEFLPADEWDNVEIIKYKWDFGDGTSSTLREAEHTYEQEGEYTVTLTVEDAAGNVTETSTQVMVESEQEYGVCRVYIKDFDDQFVSDVQVLIYWSEGDIETFLSNSEGYVDITGKFGNYQIAVYKSGYSIREGTINIEPGQDNVIQIAIGVAQPLIGDINMKKLSLEELEDLGVDLSDPDNFYTYAFELEYNLTEKDIDTEKVKITPGSSGSGKGSSSDSITTNNKDDEELLDNDDGFSNLSPVGGPEAPSLASFTAEPASVSWLKDMYEIKYTVYNCSSELISFENAQAELCLPAGGLSLTKTTDNQTLIKELGTISGGMEATASWIVNVDQEGTYDVGVIFRGNLQPFNENVECETNAEGTFRSTNGEGLHLYIYPETTAHTHENYYIQYKLTNESNHDCNYVTVKFGKFQTERNEQYIYNYVNGELVDTIHNQGGMSYVIPSKEENGNLPIICSGDSLTIETLKPGDSIYGTYVRHFRWLGDPHEVYYELKSAFVKEIEEETNGKIKVTVCPMNGHITKGRVWFEVNMGAYTDPIVDIVKGALSNLEGSFSTKVYAGDPVNIMTGGFESSQTVMQVLGVVNIGFVLNYNSLNTEEKGDMGYGWHHNYEYKLEETGNGINVYLNPNSYTTFVNENAMNSVVEGTYINGTMYLGGSVSQNNLPSEDNSVSGNSVSENTVIQNETPDKNTVITDNLQDYDTNDIEEGKNTYLPVSGALEGYKIIKSEAGYCMFTPKQTIYQYDSEGNLTAIINETGQTISITRNENQMVIADNCTGKSITAVYDENGNIVTLRDNGGNQVQFAYDENNNMISQTSKGGTTNYYEYDEEHRITVGKDTNGKVFVENTYDEKGRVIKQDDGNEATAEMTLQYTDNEEDGTTTISVKNTNGGTENAVADMYGNGLSYTNTIGGVTNWEYDESQNLLSYKEDGGENCTFTYDEKGNILTRTEATGKTTSYTYNEKNQVISKTCNDGTSQSYSYDENNRLVSITAENGAIVRYEYNENGQVTKEIVEGLGETIYRYSDGMLTQVTDCNGNICKYIYDSIGNVVQYTDGKGTVTDYEIAPNGKVLKEIVTLPDGSTATTGYEYDAYGNRTKVTDANGNSTGYEYDKNDNLIKETRADGSVIGYERDVDGNITKITYPDNKTTVEAVYDTAGNLLSLKDALKSTTVQNFNSGSRITNIQLANGGEITYQYYDNGLLKSETDAMGGTITYNYDSAGRVTGIIDRMGNTTTYGYDAHGNATTVTNAEGETVTISYNKYRQAVATTDAKGNTTQYAYDGMGNCIKTTDALGHATEYEYNGNNEVVKVTRKGEKGNEDIVYTYAYDNLGNVTAVTDGEGNSFKMDYDKVGNLKTVYDAYGVVIESYGYDKVYNQTSMKDAIGNDITYTYDSLGNLISMLNNSSGSLTTYTYVGGKLMDSSTDALGGTVTATYDSMGNVKSFTNPNGGTTTYTYNLNNQVISEAIGTDYNHSYEYDANGNVTKKTNSKGQVTEYSYDKAGRLAGFKDELGTTSYKYDDNGNLSTVTEANGTEAVKAITREYDALNRVTSYTDARGNTIRYTYDEFGNITTLTYPNEKQVSYTYDKNGNIKTVTDWEGRTTSYEYDKNSRLVKTTRPNGTVETRTYDKAGQLVSILDKKGTEIVNSQEYTYDATGNITAVSSSQDGKLQNSTELSETAMEYDKTNRLIKYNGAEVKYDKDGNMVYGPLNGVMTDFTYDCRNRLIQAGTTKYEYDAEDNRIAVVKNAGTASEVRTEYVVDSVEELSRTLMATEIKAGSGVATANDETSPEGTTTYFYYGNGLLAQKNAQEGYLTYHFNNVGSTNAVTDENGKIKYSYDYNPYGELTKGSYGQVMFLFNGQYGVVSDDNGLYYMRARYYNVSIKRFINQDIVTGNLAESQSLNRYAYVEGNPVSYMDPFGLEPLLTDELHEDINEFSMIAGGIGVWLPEVGLALEGGAICFETGVYINDYFTSKFDSEVLKVAFTSIATNVTSYAFGALSYFKLFGIMSDAIGSLVSKISWKISMIQKILDDIKDFFDDLEKEGES